MMTAYEEGCYGDSAFGAEHCICYIGGHNMPKKTEIYQIWSAAGYGPRFLIGKREDRGTPRPQGYPSRVETYAFREE